MEQSMTEDIHDLESWWDHVDQNWAVFVRLLDRFLKAPEKRAKVLDAYQNRDALILWRLLEQTWADAPDQSWIRELSGWFELCDACSEFDTEWLKKGETDGPDPDQAKPKS